MRVLHVATLMTPDGRYGGPIRVALNQAAALVTLGADVTFISGYQGDLGAIEDSPPGVERFLFPVSALGRRLGYAGLYSLAMVGWLRHHVRNFDLVHIHLARDLITLPAARLAQRRGVMTVLQTHGMVDGSDKFLARPVDRVLTKRVLRAADRILYLTDRERTDLVGVAESDLRLTELPNGVPVAAQPPVHRLDAHPLEVLFMSRLHPRKRPDVFARAARNLADTGATFAIVGPDEGALQAVLREVSSDLTGRIRYEGALPPSETAARMARADLFVLPSVDEPFPMAALEAMSLGLPIIVTESCGLAPHIEAAGAGLVVGPSQGELEVAIRRFLSDAGFRRQTADAARRLASAHFSIEAVGARLRDIYSETIHT